MGAQQILPPPLTSISTALGAALVLAIEKGWITGDGKPAHQVCLTDEEGAWQNERLAGTPARSRSRSRPSTTRCPICGHSLGELGLEKVLAHL